MSGLFIVFEGIDGCGKSTQAKLLTKYLQKQNIEVLLTTEPSKGPVGSFIRSKILSGKEKVTNYSLIQLFATDRAEHLATTVLPALKENKIVICDRYFISNLAYQGLILPFKDVWEENRRFLKPDLLIYLSVLPEQVEEVFKRVQERHSQKEVFEKLNIQKKVVEKYTELLSERDTTIFTKRVLNLSALEGINDIHNSIVKVVDSISANEDFV